MKNEQRSPQREHMRIHCSSTDRRSGGGGGEGFDARLMIRTYGGRAEREARRRRRSVGEELELRPAAAHTPHGRVSGGRWASLGGSGPAYPSSPAWERLPQRSRGRSERDWLVSTAAAQSARAGRRGAPTASKVENLLQYEWSPPLRPAGTTDKGHRSGGRCGATRSQRRAGFLFGSAS